MVSALNRKLLRDLWHLRSQMISVALVVSCAAGVFMTMRGMYEALSFERAEYYQQYRFADVFAQMKRAPEPVAARLAAIPGVATLETGVALTLTLDVPGLAEPASAQLISIPERGRPRLNDLLLREGRHIEPGARDEVLVNEAFATANGLAPGATLGAVINGRWQKLHVVGIASSPEFIYVLRPASGLPDNKRYGILWMGRDAVAHAYDMVGAFNRISVALAQGASESGVIDGIDRELARYGTFGAYGRKDHLSDKVISDEINQDRIYGFVVSGIFLVVAAFLINIVLSRLVATQRDQIAVLKAFGYSDAIIGWHYLKLTLIAVILGVAGGVPVAYGVGSMLADIYRGFFHLPQLDWSFSLLALAIALMISLAAAAAGAWSAVVHAVRLPPAEAMRPEAPAQFRASALERIGFQRWLPMAGRMITRNIERRPWKAAASVTGIALALAILIAGRFGMDALDHIIDVQFRMAQREDVMIEFSNPLSASARYDVKTLPGVMQAEAFRFVPARLRFQHRVRRTGIIGLPPEGDLRAIIDLDYHRYAPPIEGMLISAKLAASLGVVPGDVVTVEVMEGKWPVRAVTIAGTLDDLVGVIVYMSLPNLSRLLDESGTYSGAFLTVDQSQRDALYAKLKQLPEVRATSVKAAMLSNFREVIARSLTVQTIMNVFFACVIAFGVVYNSMRIALSERGRELASLRVLGFTEREVATMLLGEQALLTVAAMPLGCVIGYGISWAVVTAVNAHQETFRLPLVLSSQTFAFAFMIVAAAAVLSGIVIWRRLHALDLVAVLKTRE